MPFSVARSSSSLNNVTIKTRLKRAGERLTGYWFHKLAHLPRGTDLAWDIQRNWGQDSIRLVLDIGANAGQFSGPFRERHPGAALHCFEPVAETFFRLRDRFKGYSAVQCHNLALGNSEGEARIFVNPDDTESSLLAGYGDYREETVKMTTVDKFCQSHHIDRVDFMKVDTEGFEIEVLMGAATMLLSQKIRLVFVETELLPSDGHFIPLMELSGFLRPFGYELCGIYHQHRHWDGRKSLSFVNALFAAKSMVESSAGT
jgi:FkbM family methyltransferase